MILKGNDMYFQRGETFTIDKFIENADGSPFIVSSEYRNPYLLFTVTSTNYDQQGRYVLNRWLDLKDLPRFVNTRVKKIASFDVANVVGENPMEYLYYVSDVSKCKYFDEENNWHDYNFRVVLHFTNQMTGEWVEQSYLYGIKLVSGESTKDYLIGFYESLFYEKPKDGLSVEELYEKILTNYYTSLFNKEPDVELSTKEIYDAILTADSDFAIVTDIAKPIVSFDVAQIITGPNKLVSLSGANGGI